MELHKKIRLLTKKSGLPCGVIAKKLNIVSGTFSDWRSGKACPTFAHLKDLAEFFNLTLSELLHDVDDISSKKSPPQKKKNMLMNKTDLKKYRERHNLNIEQFSEITGFSKKSIYAMENGTRNISPRIQSLIEQEKFFTKNYSTDEALIIIKDQIAQGHGVRAKLNGKNLVTVSSSRPLP